MKKNKNKGFSLVELIIVIAIMVVLAAVLAPQFIKYVESSKQSTDISNVGSYKTAIEAYVADTMPDADVELYVDPAKGIYASIDLSSEGLAAGEATATKLRSTGWGDAKVTYTYDSDTFKWTVVSLKNSKKPEKDMNSAFEN